MTAYEDALASPYIPHKDREAVLLIMRHVTEELERLLGKKDGA